MNTSRPRRQRLLKKPNLELVWLPEPKLTFAGGSLHINPKIGIPLFGPRSLNTPRHKGEVHVGFVGDINAIEKVRQFIDECKKGLSAEDIENGSIAFPGLSSDLGYRFQIISSDETIEKITKADKDRILQNASRAEQFCGMLDLIERKVKILCEKDHPLDYIFIVLEESVYENLRVIATADPLSGKDTVQRDFRRALKARLMKYKKPTQIIRESTVSRERDEREMQDLATRAWNMFTAMYYKVGGLPWGLTDIEPATCFIGISFFRPYGEPIYIRASIAQAFNEYGDGLILRGQKFKWDDELGKSPHLSETLAQQLIEDVLSRYQAEGRQKPRRVVIHKSSRFEPEEREGFKKALSQIPEYDLVTVGTTGNFRLLRSGNYPPLRGTVLSTGNIHILYTTGYIPELSKYPHPHVPMPLRVADHYGDSTKTQLLKELFVLTKMNWNTADVDGAWPITLQFARAVGDILKEIPDDQIPEPKYVYYM